MIAESYRRAWEQFISSVLVTLSSYEKSELESQLTRASEVLKHYTITLLEYSNVVGVGISLKMKEMEVRRIPCIVVFVQRKIPSDRLAFRERVPDEIKGIPTDVVEVGTPVLHFFGGRVRPVRPGYSISHEKVSAGTLGCLVRDRETGDVLILSNNHVIANANNATYGDPIVQPGTSDGGRPPGDTIARLERFVRVVAGINSADAAVAKPVRPDIVVPDIPGIGRPRGIRRVAPDLIGAVVQKVGRTTQHTIGHVIAIDATISIDYPNVGRALFVKTIVTTGMSKPGDSGSLLLDINRYAVGLLFGAAMINRETVATFHNEVTEVLDALRVDLIT